MAPKKVTKDAQQSQKMHKNIKANNIKANNINNKAAKIVLNTSAMQCNGRVAFLLPSLARKPFM